MHDEAVRVLPQLLELFGIRRYVAVGHSDGGSIAIIHAATAPAGLAGLVLEAPHIFVEDVTIASIREARARWTSTDLKEKLARHHAHVDSMFESWTDVWLRPEFRDWSIQEYLGSIRCPALVIQGEDDEYGTVKQVDVIEAQIGGDCRVLILPGCGHAPHVDQRAVVEDAMVQFLRRVLMP
jgi:pimeloyl-ACP methyl ester carboxylesterase